MSHFPMVAIFIDVEQLLRSVFRFAPTGKIGRTLDDR